MRRLKSKNGYSNNAATWSHSVNLIRGRIKCWSIMGKTRRRSKRKRKKIRNLRKPPNSTIVTTKRSMITCSKKKNSKIVIVCMTHMAILTRTRRTIARWLASSIVTLKYIIRREMRHSKAQDREDQGKGLAQSQCKLTVHSRRIAVVKANL